MRIGRVFLLVALLSTAVQAQTSGRFRNADTGMVLAPQGRPKQGAALVVNRDDHSPFSVWDIQRQDGPWFKLVNQKSRLVIGVTSGSTSDGATVILWHDDGTPNQQWKLVSRGKASLLVNRGSGKVMGVTGGSKTNGTPIIQWHEDGTPNQQWTLR